MGRVERLGRVLPGSGPVSPVVPAHARTRADRKDDEEADREDARREHARRRPAREPVLPDPGPHVDIRA